MTPAEIMHIDSFVHIYNVSCSCMQVGVVIDKIHRAATAGEAVDLSELLSSFTTDMVSRAVVGRSFRVDGLDKVFKGVLDASMAVLAGFNLENFYPGLANVAGGVLMWPGRRKAERLRDRWDEVLDKVIDQHASVAAAGAPPAHHESDFTHVLLSVQEEYGLTRDGIKGILSVSSINNFHFLLVSQFLEPSDSSSSSNCSYIATTYRICLQRAQTQRTWY
jgi:hypothetical protein